MVSFNKNSISIESEISQVKVTVIMILEQQKTKCFIIVIERGGSAHQLVA